MVDGVPYAKVDEALKGYASLLREKVAAENLAVPVSAAATASIAIGAQPYPDDRTSTRSSRLPQDEMRDIVTRFTARARDVADAVADRPARSGLLCELALGPEVAGLRQAVAQRPGRLPVHPRTAETQIARAN